MKIIEFTGDASQVQWPAAYEREIAALSPVEQLRYFYTTPDYERHTHDAVEKGGYEWQNPYCLYTLPVEAVELIDGKIAAAHVGGSRLVLGETVCTYYASDNNGAGYKERTDYATLTCGAPISFPCDFYEVMGDTVTFHAPLPSYPYAFMYVQVKPWEREAEGLIRHVVVGEGVTSLPKYMLEGMPGLETVRVPAAVKVIGSNLPAGCQVYVGGIRIPEWFLSHDGILVRVREDVEEIRITGDIKRIGRYAFEDCPSLKRVIIPESVVEIEEGAFAKFGDALTICCEAAACPERLRGLPTGESAPTVIWGYSL